MSTNQYPRDLTREWSVPIEKWPRNEWLIVSSSCYQRNLNIHTLSSVLSNPVFSDPPCDWPDYKKCALLLLFPIPKLSGIWIDIPNVQASPIKCCKTTSLLHFDQFRPGSDQRNDWEREEGVRFCCISAFAVGIQIQGLLQIPPRW